MQILIACLCILDWTEFHIYIKKNSRAERSINKYRSPNQGRLRKRHTNELESPTPDTQLDTENSTVSEGHGLMSPAHISPSA